MTDQKKTIILIVVFVFLLIIAVVGYNYFLKEYTKKEEQIAKNTVGNELSKIGRAHV